MDLLDRFLGHDRWTTRHLLVRSLELTTEQLHRPLDIGHQTLYRTWVHVIGNIEVWTDLIYERPVQSHPNQTSVKELIERFDAAYADFETIARRLTDKGQLDQSFTDHLDQPPVSKTFGSAIVHLITHNMHHRSEILHLLKRLGVQNLIEGDAISWELQHNTQL